MKHLRRSLKWLLIGISVVPLASAAAILSGGAGHGDYLFAKLLFPYTMLLAGLAGSITYPLIGLALFQFPLYGLAVGSFNLAKATACLFALHAVAALLCFFTLSPTFG